MTYFWAIQRERTPIFLWSFLYIYIYKYIYLSVLLLSFRKKRKEYTVTFFFQMKNIVVSNIRERNVNTLHVIQYSIFFCRKCTSGCKKKMIFSFNRCIPAYSHTWLHNPLTTSVRLSKLNRLSFAVEFPNSHPKHTVCRDQQKDLTCFCVLHILTLLYSWEEKKTYDVVCCC